MAKHAQDAVKRHFSRASFQIEAVKEQANKAVGNGTGIMYVVMLLFS